jgi:hypothetical protein
MAKKEMGTEKRKDEDRRKREKAEEHGRLSGEKRDGKREDERKRRQTKTKVRNCRKKRN